jgi:hypothetical protein
MSLIYKTQSQTNTPLNVAAKNEGVFVEVSYFRDISI